MFKIQDIPQSAIKLEQALEEINGQKISDEEIWEIAKTSEDIPNFDNIYLKLLYSKLEDSIKSVCEDIKIDYYINNLDSHFSINNEKVSSYDDIVYELLHFRIENADSLFTKEEWVLLEDVGPDRVKEQVYEFMSQELAFENDEIIKFAILNYAQELKNFDEKEKQCKK